VLAYASELDRLEMHIYDAAHLLLETHHQECASRMRDFILNVQAELAHKGRAKASARP
jgi:hypothetical protein